VRGGACGRSLRLSGGAFGQWLAVFSIQSSVHSTPPRHSGSALSYRVSAWARMLAARVRRSAYS
jgi:hypothetical protein